MKLGISIGVKDHASAGIKRVSRAVSNLGDRTSRLGSTFTGMGVRAIPRITGPILGLAGAFLGAAAHTERFETAFGTLLQDAAKGVDLFEDLRDFSDLTPFKVSEVASAGQALLAVGVEAEKLRGEVALLGDVSAGSQKDLNELTSIYAKAFAKGKVDGEIMQQLMDSKIPIVQALIDLQAQYGNEINSEDVYEAVSKGKVKFEDLRAALQLLTEEGGLYNGAMEAQSKTMFGLGSTLSGVVFTGLAEVGGKLAEIFGVKEKMQGLIDTVRSLTDSFKTFSEENPNTLELIAKAVAGVALLGPALIGFGIGFQVVGVALKGIGAALAIITSPIALAGILIAGAAWLIYDNWDGIVAFFENVWVGIKAAFPDTAAFFEGLWDKAALAVPGIFDWVVVAWGETLAWFSGPAEGQSPLEWLKTPVQGAFNWVETAWTGAKDLIAAVPAVLPWAWLGAGSATTFSWAETAWQSAKDLIAAAPQVLPWSWLEQGGPAVFSWVDDAWQAAMTAITNVAEIAVGIHAPTLAAATAWGTDLLHQITTAIQGLDFAKIGTDVGGFIGDNLVAAAGTLTGLAEKLTTNALAFDFGAVGTSIGAVMGTTLVAAVSALTGIIPEMTAAADAMDFRSIGTSIGTYMSLGVVAYVGYLPGIWRGILDRVRALDFSVIGRVLGDSIWTGAKAAIVGLAGFVTGMTTAVRAIDWTEVGEVIGLAIQTAVVGSVSFVFGLVDAINTASRDGTLLTAIGDLGLAILDGIMAVLEGLGELVVGLVTGIFSGIDWRGFVPDWAEPWIFGDGDVDPAGQGPSGALTIDQLRAKHGNEPVALIADGGDAFSGAGAGRSAAGAAAQNETRVGGEIAVRFENAPAGARVRRVRTDNPEVALVADVGYAGSGF